MLEGVFTRVWVVRVLISIAISVPCVALTAFFVSDYVVDANTESMKLTVEAVLQSHASTSTGVSAALDGIKTSVDTLNSTLQETNRVVGGLRDDTTFLTLLGKDQGRLIEGLAKDLASVKLAVEGAGIPVNMLTFKDLLQPSPDTWADIKATYGLQSDGPVFLEIRPDNLE